MIEILVQLAFAALFGTLLLYCKKAKKDAGTMAGKTGEASKSGEAPQASKDAKSSGSKDSKESKEEKKSEVKKEGGSKEKEGKEAIKTDRTMASKVEEVKKEGEAKPEDKAKEGAPAGDKPEEKKEGAAKEEGDKEGKPLKFSVTQLEWDEKGGQQTMTVTNVTDVKQCMKIKSSDNKLFKVHPVYSNVEPGKSQEVTVRREAAAVKSDKIVIVTAPNKDNEDPEKLFDKADLKLSTSVIRQTGKGAAKPEEKKSQQKPPDEKKPDEKKSEQKPPDDKKPEEKKPDEKKPDEKKADEKKSEQKPAEEKKPEEKK